jgi:hypothetical protein
MPGSFLGELILQPLFELALQLFGYVTGRIVVPILSFGSVRVEGSGDENPTSSVRWLKRKSTWRDSRGKLVLDADVGAFCGILFWIAVGVVAFVMS